MQHGSGATDTHNLAEQAKRQAQQTVSLAAAAGRQADQTAILAANAVGQAKAANNLAIQAQRSADYAKESIQNSVEADRPWIGISSVDVNPLAAGELSKARFTFTNSGKRPAIVTLKTATGEFLSLPPALFAGRPAFRNEAIMLPGASLTNISPYSDPNGETKQPTREHWHRFFLAEVVYTDVQTNEVHITHFCAFYEPKNQDAKFPLCPNYNDTK